MKSKPARRGVVNKIKTLLGLDAHYTHRLLRLSYLTQHNSTALEKCVGVDLSSPYHYYSLPGGAVLPVGVVSM